MSYRSGELSAQLHDLLNKMGNSDQDLRSQALIDLQKELERLTDPSLNVSSSSSQSSSSRKLAENVYTDESSEGQLVQKVLSLLNDEIAEVKNKAVICLSIMSRKSRVAQIQIIVNDLLSGVASDKDERRDITCMALKGVASEMPLEGKHIPPLVEKIINKVFGILTAGKAEAQTASELLQTLNDIFLRYPDVISSSASLQKTSLDSLIQVLSARASIRKRAIPALSSLVSNNPQLFDSALKKNLLEGLNGKGESSKIWIAVVASLSRGRSVAKIGRLISDDGIVKMILRQTEVVEDVEAVEGALVALEALLLRCPAEITPFLSSVTQRALALVKYDPNYVELDEDEDEDEAMDTVDSDNDDFDDDAYSDDEDESWKIRRAAAKVLQALVGTRNELLAEFYRDSAPVLITRFSEREESVRLEVMATFEGLLKQTAAARGAELASGGRNKRKRSEGMDEDSATEESVVNNLRLVTAQLLRAILKQITSKSVATRQQCFVLLRQMTEMLEGGLDSEADAICTATIAALRTVDSAITSSLATSALSFMAVFFQQHLMRTFASHLETLMPPLIRCMKDKLQRINFEAFAVASALAQALRPQGSASPLANNYTQPIRRLFTATTEILGDPSVDSDVRERALDTLGNLLVYEGDALSSSYSVCFPLISARLTSEATVATAVSVIGRIAESPTCRGSEFDNWLLQVLPEVVVALRRNRRSGGKNAEFHCVQLILTRIGSSLPTDIAEGILTELQPLIESPPALQSAAAILTHQPASRPVVDSQLLPQILAVIKTPSVNPHLVDALAIFFGAYVDGNVDSATRLVTALVDNLGKTRSIPDATRGGTSTYTTTARCIGAVIEHSPAKAAGAAQTFQKTIKSSKATEADVYLALLSVGEIGRTTDLSALEDLFDQVLGLFKNESEEVRSAAAFAAGNLAVGSPDVILPALLKRVPSADTESFRLLSLHALKEVILHSSSSQLEGLADSLWNPMFTDTDIKPTKGSQATSGDDIGDDGVRNVKAACIGKLTTTAPGKFLPELQKLLKSSPRNRAIVAAAVRYTFIDTSSSYDELIAPIIVDFLSLMKDQNLIVRRLSLASLNAAIQNKPHLIIDRLGALQPLLYQETHVKPELQREVQMGPWKVIEDDGLENRKTAYETMYTMLGTCFSKIDLPTFTERVMVALRDVNEIKVLGLMLLLRLGQLSPTSIIPRLDDVTESLKLIMKDIEVKDDTVIKQDLEGKEEMQRNTLRTAVPLYKMSTAQQAPVFHEFVGGLLTKSQWREFKDLQG